MRKKKFSAWGVLVIFIVFITVIVALVQHNNPLPDYRRCIVEDVSSAPDVSKSGIKTVAYINESPVFTVDVPADWVKIVKNGYATWIDKASASSFQIQIGESDPAILEVTRESVAAELAAAGTEFVNFYWISEWDFACLYRVYTESGSTANIEITALNQQHIVRFVFVINEAYYTRLENTVAMIVDSFVWERWG